jgi:hypothetical protein
VRAPRSATARKPRATHAHRIAAPSDRSPSPSFFRRNSADFAVIASEGFWRVMTFGRARTVLRAHLDAGGAKADASLVLKAEALVRSAERGENNHDIAIAVLFF